MCPCPQKKITALCGEENLCYRSVAFTIIFPTLIPGWLPIYIDTLSSILYNDKKKGRRVPYHSILLFLNLVKISLCAKKKYKYFIYVMFCVTTQEMFAFSVKKIKLSLGKNVFDNRFSFFFIS